jgi:hypothetical protein
MPLAQSSYESIQGFISLSDLSKHRLYTILNIEFFASQVRTHRGLGSIPEGKTAGARSWPLTSSSTDVKNAWSYTSTPQYAFMVWCSVKKSTGTTLPLPLSYLSKLRLYTILNQSEQTEALCNYHLLSFCSEQNMSRTKLCLRHSMLCSENSGTRVSSLYREMKSIKPQNMKLQNKT